MKSFTYQIKEKLGLHARPAGMLVKKAKEYKSVITLEKSGSTVNLTKLMAVMSMGVKCGDTVTVIIDGSDEDTALNGIKEFFENNL